MTETQARYQLKPGRPAGTVDPLSKANRRRLLADLQERAVAGDSVAATCLILLAERKAAAEEEDQ